MIAPEKEYLERIRVVMQRRRIALSLKQSDASRRSGINLSTLRYFEQHGEISLENLLRLMNVYGMDSRIIRCFEDMSWWSVDELKNAENKKKVR